MTNHDLKPTSKNKVKIIWLIKWFTIIRWTTQTFCFSIPWIFRMISFITDDWIPKYWSLSMSVYRFYISASVACGQRFTTGNWKHANAWHCNAHNPISKHIYRKDFQENLIIFENQNYELCVGTTLIKMLFYPILESITQNRTWF